MGLTNCAQLMFKKKKNCIDTNNCSCTALKMTPNNVLNKKIYFYSKVILIRRNVFIFLLLKTGFHTNVCPGICRYLQTMLYSSNYLCAICRYLQTMLYSSNYLCANLSLFTNHAVQLKLLVCNLSLFTNHAVQL